MKKLLVITLVAILSLLTSCGKTEEKMEAQTNNAPVVEDIVVTESGDTITVEKTDIEETASGDVVVEEKEEVMETQTGEVQEVPMAK